LFVLSVAAPQGGFELAREIVTVDLLCSLAELGAYGGNEGDREGGIRRK